MGSDFGLCPDCLIDTPFLTGPVCDRCGVRMLVEDGDGTEICDDCVALPRPWTQARAVFRYTGQARRLVLALKHGDRLDLARAAGPWMARVAKPLCHETTTVVPIPLHPWRQFRRRYNQAAELARALSREARLPYAPDALRRARHTPSLDHRTRDERMDVMVGAISAQGTCLKDRHVLLVDDVMTSGATMAAAADAALGAGALRVDCVVLARVEKDDPGL
jgi:ComF family protein